MRWARLIGAQTFSAETLQLLTRITTQPSGQRQQLINATVNALVRTGVWAKLDGLWLMAAHDSQTARLNWIGNTYTLSPVNSPTFTADRGYEGNGSTSYLNTTFNPAAGSNYTQNSASIGVFMQTTGGDNNNMAIGNQQTWIRPLYLGLFEAQFNANSGGALSGAGGTDLGFTSLSRPGGTVFYAYKDGALITSPTNTSDTLDADTFFIGAQNNAGTPAFYRTGRASAAFVGGNLTDAEQEDLYDILQIYMTGVGA